MDVIGVACCDWSAGGGHVINACIQWLASKESPTLTSGSICAITGCQSVGQSFTKAAFVHKPDAGLPAAFKASPTPPTSTAADATCH